MQMDGETHCRLLPPPLLPLLQRSCRCDCALSDCSAPCMPCCCCWYCSVVNVSSGLARPAMEEMSKEHRAAFEKPDLTVAEVGASTHRTGRRRTRCEGGRGPHSRAAVCCCCCFSLMCDFLPSQLDGLISSYRSACLSTGAVANGWPASVYGLSKAAVVALSRILGRDATNGGEEPWPPRTHSRTRALWLCGRGFARVVCVCVLVH